MRTIGLGTAWCHPVLEEHQMYPGGEGLNFAVYSKMLGADAAFLGELGQDFGGQHIQSLLNHLDIEYSHCRQWAGRCRWRGITWASGRPTLTEEEKSSKLPPSLELTQEDLKYLSTFQLCYTGSTSQMNHQLSAVKSTGILLSYGAPHQWAEGEDVEEVAPYVDYMVLFCGALGLHQVEEVCQRVHQKGASMVLGVRGSLSGLLLDGRDCYVQKFCPQPVGPGLGTGDAFAASFLMGWLKHQRRGRLAPGSHLYRRAIGDALLQGARYAAEISLLPGFFGYGCPIPSRGGTLEEGALRG